jgi:DMSO/TMAO reductase YedYZ molybdopterin-dependent catalytic subunit
VSEPDPSTLSEPDPSTVGRARLAGLVAAAVALGVTELVAALAAGRSVVAGVGDEVVDRAGGGVVRWAIEVFGTADKVALVIGIVVVSLGVGALLGGWSLRHRGVGPVGFVAFGALGALAALRDPLGSAIGAVLAPAIGAVAGTVVLWALLRVAGGSGPSLAATTRSVATTRPGQRPGDRRASRRAFLGWAGTAGAVAAAAGVAATALRGRTTTESARAAVRLPAVAGGATPVPATGVEVPGITPYITPNDRFYRIDTALVTPQVDLERWRLSVTGLVDEPYELTFDELLGLPMVTEAVTLACVSNEVGGRYVGNAVWQGVPLAALLERAGVRPEGTQVVGRSVDGFTAGFPTEAVFDGRVALVAVGMNGEPLPVAHGFPARLVVAGLYGYVSATKWLRELRLTRWEDVDGYWIPRGWAKEAPIKTQSRIDVPAAGAELAPGPTPIAGVAWAPGRGIARVEVQVDDGEWREARLGEVLSANTWVQWMLPWDATPGVHTLRVRATDGTGEVQTAEVSPPAPDGATGRHTRRVRVTG